MTFIYRQAGGGKSAPITVTSKKMPNGKFMAVHNQVVDIKKATNTKYMVEVVGKGIISDWAASMCRQDRPWRRGGLATRRRFLQGDEFAAWHKGPKTEFARTGIGHGVVQDEQAGHVGFRLMRKDGPVGPMIFVPSVKSASGYMATYSKTIAITKSMNTAYSAVVPGRRAARYCVPT